MAAKDWAGITAGLALAAFGLGAYVASGSTAPADEAAPATTTTVASPAVRTVMVTETIPSPDVEIPGLSPEAARVLSSSGYAGFSERADLGLSASVTRTLERAGVVLLVPDGEAP